MTPDELDEAILDLSKADYDELECMALDYCIDHKNFTRGNDFQKGIMLQSAMRMMMKEQINGVSWLQGRSDFEKRRLLAACARNSRCDPADAH